MHYFEVYSASISIHRATWPPVSRKLCSHLREFWSVLAMNLWPYKQGWKWRTPQTSVSNSLLVAQYFCSALVSALLPYAMTRSWPSMDCERTAPKPFLLASMSSIKSQLKSARLRIGAVTRWCFSVLSAKLHSSVESHAFPFSDRRCSGAAIFAKFLTNLR